MVIKNQSKLEGWMPACFPHASCGYTIKQLAQVVFMAIKPLFIMHGNGIVLLFVAWRNTSMALN